MKIKNWNNERNIIQKKNPTKLPWSMSAKSEKNIFYLKRKKNKITMTHESQIWYLVNRLLPGSIYNEIRNFLDRL